MIPLRYSSPSATFIREAMRLPLPQKWIDLVLSLDDIELAAASGSTPVYEYEMGGHPKLVNINLRARQEAFVLARLRKIQAIEACRIAGLDPNDLEDRVSIDGVDVRVSEYEAAGQVKAIVSEKGRVAMMDLLDDVGTALNTFDKHSGVLSQIPDVARAIDMLRGSMLRCAHETTGQTRRTGS